MRYLIAVTMFLFVSTAHADFNPWSGSSHSTLKDSTPKATARQLPRRAAPAAPTRSDKVAIPRRTRTFNYGQHRHVHGGGCGWVNGYWQPQTIQVWIPGQRLSKWIPQVYRYENGKSVVITPGYYIYKDVPGYYETRMVTNWVSGRWACLSTWRY